MGLHLLSLMFLAILFLDVNVSFHPSKLSVSKRHVWRSLVGLAGTEILIYGFVCVFIPLVFLILYFIMFYYIFTRLVKKQMCN